MPSWPTGSRSRAGRRCGLDFDGGPGNCGAVAPQNERFMLTETETRAEPGPPGSSETIDLIGMLRGRAQGGPEAAG